MVPPIYDGGANLGTQKEKASRREEKREEYRPRR